MSESPPAALLPSILLRNVRIVPLEAGHTAYDRPVDVRIRHGQITDIGDLTPERDEALHDADGAWAIPGLWDHHVHMKLWASMRQRINLAGTTSPAEATERVRAHIEQLPGTDPTSLVLGFGHRLATWGRPATVHELDAVSGAHPVVLISGDAHNGWLNSAALRLLHVPQRNEPLTEAEWFPVFARLEDLQEQAGADTAAYVDAVRAASARGIVGIGDMEFANAQADWVQRFSDGVNTLRVRAAVYPDGLDAIIAAGLRTGDELGESAGLLRMGPLKIIGDGSLNTRSAYCCEPYADEPGSRGAPNLPWEELRELCARATAHGLALAVHAIGDAAIAQTLDCFAATGGRGTMEHAQLIRHKDITRMAALGIAASVQPAHLLDDRDVTMQCWPDRADRCFMLRTLLSGGVELRLGSDAPVSPLDPWLTIAAAVHRSADEREPWFPGESLTPREALAASVDGQGTLSVGGRGDVVLLGSDPLSAGDLDPFDAQDTAAAAETLRDMEVVATFVGGRATFER